MSAPGPLLPSTASAGHGSYLGISCRQRGRRTTAENDPFRTSRLFDHLVGEREQRRGHGEAERLGCPEVDHEFELGRLYDRQVCGCLALQDAADINADLASRFVDVDAIAHQATHLGILPK